MIAPDQIPDLYRLRALIKCANGAFEARCYRDAAVEARVIGAKEALEEWLDGPNDDIAKAVRDRCLMALTIAELVAAGARPPKTQAEHEADMQDDSDEPAPHTLAPGYQELVARCRADAERELAYVERTRAMW